MCSVLGRSCGRERLVKPGAVHDTLEPHNLMVLEVREEILRTQVNNKRCDGPWLVKGIVNEKTTYSEEKSRESCD